MTLAGRLQLHALGVVAVVLLAILLVSDAITWRDLVLPGAIGVAAALAISRYLATRLSVRLGELTEAALALARGDMSVRPPLFLKGELGVLATAIHRVSEQVQTRAEALGAEDALLASLIEALDEGVVAIDRNRQVVRINSAAREILGVNQPVPFPADMLPRVRALQQAIASAFGGEPVEPVETPVGARSVSLTVRPLRQGGVVLALFDLTQVRRLELVRRDFVANVSHELRTPLTVIGGFAETLAEDDPAPERRRQFAATIRSHTERMQRIVDDLLDLSRLESGRWEPELTPLDLHAAAEEVAGTYRRAAEAKGLRLEVDVPRDLEPLSADRTAVRQILSNLVDNAVRHTTSGAVTIFATPETRGTWIGVRDSGPGIAREHLSRIFERFYRVDSGRSRESGGTGLGLAIVKHLVEAHGGTVRAESALASGTTISAFLPDAQG